MGPCPASRGAVVAALRSSVYTKKGGAFYETSLLITDSARSYAHVPKPPFFRRFPFLSVAEPHRPAESAVFCQASRLWWLAAMPVGFQPAGAAERRVRGAGR